VIIENRRSKGIRNLLISMQSDDVPRTEGPAFGLKVFDVRRALVEIGIVILIRKRFRQ
jgi:hypothetical protein